MNYLIHINGVGAFIDVPVGTNSEEYGRIQREFAERFGNGSEDYASMVKFGFGDQINGVRFDWGLAGPDGAWYVVYQLPENSDEAVKAAVEKLERDQDVVRLSVKKLKTVEFEIFQNL